MMDNRSFDDFVLPDEDREKLKYLTVPVPENEAKRIGILQQTRLLDSSPNEPSFDRFTHLTSLIFDMPVSVISLVDVDRVWFKSRQGVDWTDVSRNESFSSYLVMPDASDVLVVPDVSADNRFRTFTSTYNGEAIRFFAGAAVVVDGVRIGSLCVLDTVAHPEFGADDRENLLDICAGVSHLASERRQHILNLNAERANIVISMMHNLRTPMTTLNFASDMLRAEAEKFRPPKDKETLATTAGGIFGSNSQSLSKSKDDEDSGDEPEAIVLNSTGAAQRSSFVSTLAATSVDTAQMTVASATTLGQASTAPGDGQGVPEAKSEEVVTNIDNIEPSFSTFDVCFREITVALKQLNLLVDSSLNLGQALVKINTFNTFQDTLHSESESRTLESMSATMSERSFRGNLSTVSSACPSKETTPKAGSIKGVARVGEFELYPEMRQSRLVVCDLLEHIDLIYHSLIHQVVGVSVSWEMNPAYLSLGKHASYPDAVGLVLITTLGQLNSQYRNVRVRFSFERFTHEDDLEYPNLRNKVVEGMLVIKVQSYTKSARSRRTQEHTPGGEAAVGVEIASEEMAFEPNLTQAAHHPRNMYNMQHPRDLHGNLLMVDTLQHAASPSGQSSAAVTPASVTDGVSESPPPRNSAEDLTNRYTSAYNLMSLNKVLRTLNGGCREYPEPIPDQPQHPNVHSAAKVSAAPPASAGAEDKSGVADQDGDNAKKNSYVNFAAAEQSAFPPVCTPTQEFWIPCKILLSADNLAAMAAGKEVLTEEGISRTVQRTKAHWGSHSVSKKNSLGYDYTSSSGKEGLHSVPTSTKLSTEVDSSDNVSLTVSKNRHTSVDLSAGVSNVEESSPKGAVSETRVLPPSPKAEPKVLRVLIIEDTIPVQKLLSRWMQKARCKVTCAGNGSIGLNQLMSNCFDIVFVDFLMPVMLGTTTMKHFQAWVAEHAEMNEIAAYNKHMLVIGMSATALQSEQEAAFDYGMHFFCPKPANMDILSLMIEAKRQCRSNEEALDMICEATGTDVWQGPSGEEEGQHEGQEFGEGVDITSPRATLPARAPSIGLMGLGTVSLATESMDQGADSNKCSTKSSTKGSDRGSGKEVNSVASEGEASATSATIATIATNTSGATGLAGANAVGVTSGSSISSHLSSAGLISLAAPTVKVVTDSKSAAMWSVFRSYRQSARYTMPSTAGSSRQPSFLSAHSVQSGPSHASQSIPEGNM